MRFDFRTTSDVNAERVALFSPAARLFETKGTPAPRPRLRHPSVQLLDAVMRLAGEHGELISHAERPWASATFSGARHTFTLLFNGADGVAAADHFLNALPDHEFNIRGQLVADAAVSEVTHVTLPVERMVVECDLLLLVDI
jgi:hypothetical protein